MKAKLYGIGVGPGDPELLTLKALRLIRESPVIALPGKVPEETTAYKIVVQIYPELAAKELLPIAMPMTKDPAVLEASHRAGAELISEYLEAGRQVAFLTLGDPTVYATYLYVHTRIQKMGYDVDIASGIPSFCAAAARLNIGLVEKAEQLHVIPASYQIEDALKLPGTKVLMKSGKMITAVKTQLTAMDAKVMMIENCGMVNEKIYNGAEEIPDDAGYYSLIIVKEKP